MLKRIVTELRHHIPFTAIGAVTGIVVMVIIVSVGVLPQVNRVSSTVFYVLHPLHVVLSAMVTTSLYKKYGSQKIWAAVLVGYFGSVGIATISDSLIPYLGESLLNLPHAEAHIGFIEEWQIVNPAALLGIAIGYWKGAVCDISPDGVVKSLRYAIDLVGEDYVALGSDFDGATRTAFDTSELAVLTQKMTDNGFSDGEITKVMGDNSVRFLLSYLPK